MSRRIDAYTHIVTEPVLEKLIDIDPSVADRLGNADHFHLVEPRIDDMDRVGVDKQVLTGLLPMTITGFDRGDALDVTRTLNDEIRRVADEHPDRFIPTATLPFLTGEYVEEFERCVDDLEMKGVQVWSNIDGEYLDSESFHPFYTAAERANLPIWIHPRIYPWHDFEAEDTWMYSAIGWPFETTIALTRLVFNGVLEEFSDLRFVAHHLGGFLPYLEDRIMSFRETAESDAEWWGRYVGMAPSLPRPIDEYFDRIYADTAISPRGPSSTLDCGLDFFGTENLLYATDYPWGPHKGRAWLENSIDAIDGMDVTDEERADIYANNLERLLDV